MWQASGTEDPVDNYDAKTFIDELNTTHYAGYADWRLPTIPELMSLMEPERRNDDLHIHTFFNNDQSCLWSSDDQDTGSAWGVDLSGGDVKYAYHTNDGDLRVRAVRSVGGANAEERLQSLNSYSGKSAAGKRDRAPQAVTKPSYQLRSTPKKVSDDHFEAEFGLDGDRKSKHYIQNEYVDNGDGTVTDQATGLMWQKSGSDKYMKYDDVKTYINDLNHSRFAGYSGWRLPTIPELMSLLEPTQKNDNAYIDPVFDNNQWWCWSSDSRDSGSVWLVGFGYRGVSWTNHENNHYIRAVRCG